MVGKELEAGAVDCKLPNVRKTFWRSATWSSHCTSLNTKQQPFSVEDNTGFPTAPGDANFVPSTQEHNQYTRCRAPLPPLQPLSITKKALDEWPSAGLDDVGGDWSLIPATPGGRKAKTSFDIKLDLASIQRTAAEPTEIQLKRDKFAHFDKQCSRVADYHIYLGSDAVARDRETLRANGITHVLNCVGFVCPEYFNGELNYKTLWLQDSPCEDITSLLYDVFDYFEDVREQGGRVFVHCCQGVSRSTSLVIAYLMWRERSSFEDAFQDVKAARGVTNPNMGFACQLLQCQKRVHATPMSPNAVLRMYRIAPHSPYDPLHLVPKGLSHSGAQCLDSRLAFVIHLPYQILVWIGRDCDPKIEQAAKEAAGQVVRYERVEAAIRVEVEGKEGPEFWALLNKYSLEQKQSSNVDGAPNVLESNLHGVVTESNAKENVVEQVRQLGVGNRKVPFYESDYVLYKTARVGGVIPPVPFMGVGVGTVSTCIPARDDGWSVLRRKFLLGKLALIKETTPHEKTRPDPVLPETSVAFASWCGSANSLCSRSPIDTDCNSPFDSPVSRLSDLSPYAVHSPATPFATPSAQLESLSPCTAQTSFLAPFSHAQEMPPVPVQNSTSASLSIRFSPPHPYHPVISSLCISSSAKNQVTQKASKGSTSSLSERRGGVIPGLHVQGSGNKPPPAPIDMPRKPKLPPIITEKHRVEQTFEAMEITSPGLEARGGTKKVSLGIIQDAAVQDLSHGANLSKSATPSESSKTFNKGLEEGRASLYLWPDLERIDMFDANDLDTKAAFILLAPCTNERDPKPRVFIWVGRQFAMTKKSELSAKRDGIWHQAGQEFLKWLHLPLDIPIRVVNEGQESEEFWELFREAN